MIHWNLFRPFSLVFLKKLETLRSSPGILSETEEEEERVSVCTEMLRDLF